MSVLTVLTLLAASAITTTTAALSVSVVAYCLASQALASAREFCQ